ncbi:MAG: macro domain-containing protein [Micropruina sp.]
MWTGRSTEPAGKRLLEACRRLRRSTWPDGLPVGEAVATEAFDLPSRWVIHTVGPNAHRGQTDAGLLASCFTRSLDVAAELGATSVAFPAISAGAYGWDLDEVAGSRWTACATIQRRGSPSSGSCCSATAPTRPSWPRLRPENATPRPAGAGRGG